MPIQLKSKITSYLVNLLIDFVLLIIPLLTIYSIKYNRLYLNQNILNLLPIYILSWLIPTIIGKKFGLNFAKEERLINQIKPYLRSFLIQLGLLSVILYALKWYFIPRFVLLGSIAGFFLLEILLLSGSYFLSPKKEKKSQYVLAQFFMEFTVMSFGIHVILY